MSRISLFALLGLAAIGASNLSFIPPLLFILIWVLASIRKEWEFRPSPNLEAFIILIGFLLAGFIGELQDIHLFVRLGNGLAVIQLLRMSRNLNNRERTASLVISFTQIAISTQVVLGFGFILILLSFIYLLPAALRELNLHSTMSLRVVRDHRSCKAFNDFLTLATVSCLFFLLFPRIPLPQQHYSYVSFSSTANLPSSAILSDSPSRNRDSLIMLIEGKNLDRLHLYTLDTYRNGRWKRTPKGRKEKVISLHYSPGKLLERKVMVIDIRRLGRFLPHDGNIVSAKGDYFRTFLLTTGDDYRITPTRLSGTGKYSYFITTSFPKRALSSYGQKTYLSVPELSSEFTGLVHRLTKGIEKEEEKVYRLESYLKSSLTYVREAPKRNMSFGEFLSVEKKGTCLDFAGALTMMLRITGIPARVVAGYLPGVGDEKQTRYKIYQRDAHSWVEAYLKGKGWVSLDPTPSARQLAQVPFLTRVKERIQDIWYWKIIGFSPPEQERVLRSLLSFIKNTITRNFYVLPGILLAPILVFFVLKHRFHLAEARKNTRPLPMSKKISAQSKVSFYTYMNKLLRQLGYQRLANETPLEFVCRLSSEEFARSEEIEFLSWCFCRVRYGGETLPARTREKVDSSLLYIKELVPPILTRIATVLFSHRTLQIQLSDGKIPDKR